MWGLLSVIPAITIWKGWNHLVWYRVSCLGNMRLFPSCTVRISCKGLLMRHFSNGKLLRAIVYCHLWAFHLKRWQAKWALELENWDMTGRKKAWSLWKTVQHVLKPLGLWLPQWWVWAFRNVENSPRAHSALSGLIKQKAVMSASCWQNWIKPTLPESGRWLYSIYVQLHQWPPWLLTKKDAVFEDDALLLDPFDLSWWFDFYLLPLAGSQLRLCWMPHSSRLTQSAADTCTFKAWYKGCNTGCWSPECGW